MKFKSIKAGIVKHAPTILTIAAIASTVGAVASAIVMRPKYDKIIEEKKKALKEDEKVTKKDILVAGMKAYWPTLILIAVSATCGVSANIINAKRVAEYAGVAATTKELYDRYRESAEKHLKSKAKEEVADDIAKEKMEQVFSELPKDVSIPKQKSFYGPKAGEPQLMCDVGTGTPFEGEANEIERRFNKFNSLYILKDHHDYIPATWFYEEMDIPVDADFIKHLGWAYDRKEPLEFTWVPYPIQSGPYAGKIVWGFQLRPGSEPLDVDL